MAEQTNPTVVTAEKFTKHLDMLKNIRQGHDAGRFKFTRLEINALEFSTEFMERSLEGDDE